jgi:hypothetical protein
MCSPYLYKNKIMGKVKIYTLIDSRDNTIRYIGKTIQSLNNRLSSHCSLSDNDLTHRANWIRELKTLKLKPIIELIEEVDENIWEEREIYWIEYYSKLYKLTNTDKGGKGSHKVKSDTRIKKSITSKQMWDNPEYREKMKHKLKNAQSKENRKIQSEKMKEKWADDEYIKKMKEVSKKTNPKNNSKPKIKNEKISKLRKEEWSDEIYRNNRIMAQPNSKIVICDGIEYISIGEAARSLSLYKTTIIKRIKSEHFSNYYYKN